AGRAYWFLHVHYDDLHDVVKVWESLPDHVRQMTPRPQGNNVRISSHLRSGSDKKPALNVPSVLASPELFTPAAYVGKPGDWGKVVIDVSPAKIRVVWDRKFVGELDPTKVVENNRNQLEARRRRDPENPMLRDIVPQFELQGGLGLYLFESYASFR